MFILRRFSCLLLAGLFLSGVTAHAEGPGQFAVASAHPLATEAGIEVLNAGGNAFDAAVAISAVLAVVEPYSSGFGGGGFWLLHRVEDGKQIMIDGRETAPGRATTNMYLDSGSKVIQGLSLNGARAAAIPGLTAGLVHLNDNYGKRKLGENLAPAIRHAREGFTITEHYRDMAQFRLEVLRADPEAARIFLHKNDPPPLGHVLKQPDLAKTLKKIGKHGTAGFYSGAVAEKLVAGVNAAGGIWSRDDLQRYRVVERQPIIASYQGLRIISAPPPSSGGIVIVQILNMLKHFDLALADNVTRKHLIIEAMRRAYRDRAAYLGDPDFIDIPIRRLLDEEYAEGLSLTINPDRASTNDEVGYLAGHEPVGEDTTHFSVLDAAGNRVSATLSINLPFGAGFVPAGTGVLLNDEMDDFAIAPDTPNAYGLVGREANSIAPHKRPLSSMTPTFVETDDQIGILGTPGGSRIISMVLLGVLDFAANNLPQSWVNLPRYHHQYQPDEVQFEQNGLSAIEKSGLQNLGHKLNEAQRRYGNMQAILWYKPKNMVFAASDPRGEGKAVVSNPR